MIEKIVMDTYGSRLYKLGYEDGYNDWCKQNEYIAEIKTSEYNRGFVDGYMQHKKGCEREIGYD